MAETLLERRDKFLKRTPEKTETVDGRIWGVIRTGDAGPVLLMLPGTLGRADIFWQQIESLQQVAQIVALSYPATHDLDEWASDIIGLLDRYGIGEVTIMGSSLGGYLAQYIAGKYPLRVNRLIAANTLSSVEGITTKQPYSSDIANVPIEILRAGFLKGLNERQEARPFEQELYPILYGEVEGGIPELNLKARLLALKHAPAIQPVKLETNNIVVIESDDDPLIVPPVRDGVRAFLQPSIVYRFKTGGHFPYVTQPDAYLSILEQQLGLSITGADWGTGREREV